MGAMLQTSANAFFDVIATSAFKRLLDAAVQGSALAQFLAGKCYMDGFCVGQDTSEALRWWHAAAEQGDTHACCNLGAGYADGLFGLDPDAYRAMSYYMRAKHDAIAQWGISALHAGSGGYPKNDAASKVWARKSAAQGYAAAQNLVARSSTDLNEAVTLHCKAADQGNSASQVELGKLYIAGHGIPQSDKIALSWLKKAADQCDSEGQALVGLFYMNGRVLAQNKALALEYLWKSIDQGNTNGMFYLGMFYKVGFCVTQDAAAGRELLERAAAQGNEEARKELGLP